MPELKPTPVVTHTGKRGKIAEGKSVKVKADGPVKVHELAAASGFFGMVTDIKDKDGNVGRREGVKGDEITLTIEQAQYETTQIDVGVNYAVGADVYWDGSKLVEAAAGLYAGKVTRTKDPGGAIWVLLAPQQPAAVEGGGI